MELLVRIDPFAGDRLGIGGDFVSSLDIALRGWSAC